MANIENIPQGEEAKGRILHLTLPDDLHADLKVAAAHGRVTARAYIIGALSAAVRESKHLRYEAQFDGALHPDVNKGGK